MTEFHVRNKLTFVTQAETGKLRSCIVETDNVATDHWVPEQIWKRSHSATHRQLKLEKLSHSLRNRQRPRVLEPKW